MTVCNDSSKSCTPGSSRFPLPSWAWNSTGKHVHCNLSVMCWRWWMRCSYTRTKDAVHWCWQLSSVLTSMMWTEDMMSSSVCRLESCCFLTASSLCSICYRQDHSWVKWYMMWLPPWMTHNICRCRLITCSQYQTRAKNFAIDTSIFNYIWHLWWWICNSYLKEGQNKIAVRASSAKVHVISTHQSSRPYNTYAAR